MHNELVAYPKHCATATADNDRCSMSTSLVVKISGGAVEKGTALEDPLLLLIRPRRTIHVGEGDLQILPKIGAQERKPHLGITGISH